jgi:hypothetical protein
MEVSMRLFRFTLLIMLAVGPLAAAEKAEASWEKLRTLVGDWEGTYDGKPGARVSYRLVSNGTALMETMEGEDSSQMITVYHPDGSSVVMTHYCSTGNQPRMRLRGFKDGKLDFAYLDATNLKGGATEHVMSRLVLSFPDADRLVQDWTSKQGGREHVGHFELTRKR